MASITKQRMITGTATQSAADTSTAVSFPTSLSDTDNNVLLVKKVECYIFPTILASLPNAADWTIEIIFSTELISTLSYIDPHVICRFQLAQNGVAAATTDKIINGAFEFTPNFPLYLMNETFYVIVASIGTGQVISSSLRVIADKVAATVVEKINLKTV